MRFLVLSDIHADPEGLELVLSHAHLTHEHWDTVLVLGDVVGYGSEPGKTLEILSAIEAKTGIAGNHEEMLARFRSGPDHRIPDRLQAGFQACIDQLDTSQLDWLVSLPDHLALPGLHLVHANPNPKRRFDYILSRADARIAEPHMLDNICLIGHSHVPGAFLKPYSADTWIAQPAKRSDTTWQIPSGTKAFLNPGSVWENRDRLGGRSYGFLDLTPGQDRTFSVHRL